MGWETLYKLGKLVVALIISKRVEAADETSVLRGLGEEDSVHEVILDLSLAPEKSGLLLHPGRWVQVKLKCR